MNTNTFQMSRWMKWSNCNMWESKFKSLERQSILNLIQSESKQKQSLSYLAKLLLIMLTTSPPLNTTSMRRKLCIWLKLRGRHAITMKMGFICL